MGLFVLKWKGKWGSHRLWACLFQRGRDNGDHIGYGLVCSKVEGTMGITLVMLTKSGESRTFTP